MVFIRTDDEDLKYLFDLHDNRKQALLRGILLNRVKGKDRIDTLNFIHKTILEHFASQSGVIEAQQIVEGVLSKKDVDCIFNDTLVTDQGLM